MIALIIVSMAMAGIKKGSINEDKNITTDVRKDINLAPKILPDYYYGHHETVNGWSEEFKQGMRNKAIDLLNNASYPEQEILTAIGFADVSFIINYSQPTIDGFYFPGRESVGYVNASKDLTGTYSAFVGEGDVGINIQGNISGEIKVKVWATHNISPLVLDLDGNRKIDTFSGKHISYPLLTKKELQEKTWQVMDIDGDNVLDLVEKLGPKDGLLFTTANPQKVVERGFLSGQELFGQANGYSNGFEKLKEMDLNNDKVISGEELNSIYVYQDLNNNGKIEMNEIKSVKELGITKIYTSYNSNFIGSFERNGKLYTMWDWYPNALSVKFSNIK
ncbi:MAG: hypothetical protein RMJ36_06900 [Candidatus Calescibacterium sp.]|nr:hypothetical protein [Candidatus Calescibacterium sp.]MDW8133364.1 hypothetical protein [Candidatus Calescibacterium sp.]